MKKHEVKSIIVIALPLMASFLAQRGMQFIDTVMMGWIGPIALAAGAIGVALFITTLLFCNGVLSAIGIFIARAKGEDNIADIKGIIQQGLCLALLLSIPCMLIIRLSPHLLLYLGEDPLVVKNASLLMNGMLWGFPGFLLFLVLREFIAAFSLTLIVMIVSLLAIPLTFTANYILIYGKYHFPALGIAGIGYGSAIVMWFMFLCLLIYSKKHVLLKNHLSLKSFHFDYKKLTDILSVGVPSGILFLLDSGMFLSTIIIMGYFGVSALAAHQIALQCVNIAYTLPIALSMATALQIGHAVGAKNAMQIQRVALYSVAMVLFTSAIIAIIFIAASHFIANLFLGQSTGDLSTVYSFTISFMNVSAFFLCFDALQAVLNGALRGLKDTVVPMLLSLICYWVLGVGSAYYFSLHTHLGAMGVWYGLTLGLGSAACVLILRFLKKWKHEKRLLMTD